MFNYPSSAKLNLALLFFNYPSKLPRVVESCENDKEEGNSNNIHSLTPCIFYFRSSFEVLYDRSNFALTMIIRRKVCGPGRLGNKNENDTNRFSSKLFYFTWTLEYLLINAPPLTVKIQSFDYFKQLTIQTRVPRLIRIREVLVWYEKTLFFLLFHYCISVEAF